MIVAPDGMIVNTPENMGTYDFVPPGGINTFIHGVVDVIPWIMWGNSENDRTSIGERLLSIGKGIINKSTDLFLDDIWINLFVWTNFIILCKYLYRFARKTRKKEPLSQTDSILLITALLMFVTIGVIAAFGLRA